MRIMKSAMGIVAIGLVSVATPASATMWSSPQSAVTGNLSQPSMVEDSNGAEHVVARGDTGIWYATDKSGSWARTRMTQDFDTKANGHLFHHLAVDPVIAINAGGTLTAVYGVSVASNGEAGGCDPTKGLRYTVRKGGSWSTPKRIPGTGCETATGIAVHGARIALATVHVAGNGASRVSYFTNASGSWTHVSVASGLSTDTHIGPASIAMYDGKPMLAYIKHGHLIYARGLTSVGNFIRETAATTDLDASSKPSLAINPINERQMIAWAQADGTHYAYRNAHGWYSYRVMQGSVRAVLAIDGGGTAHIAAADGAGGMWYAARVAGSWATVRVDVHTVSDLGGIGFGNGIEISYLRGTSRLFWVSSFSGC
jgi:hypothetical protein